jgi:hypothetical protein
MGTGGGGSGSASAGATAAGGSTAGGIENPGLIGIPPTGVYVCLHDLNAALCITGPVPCSAYSAAEYANLRVANEVGRAQVLYYYVGHPS